jgi:hypothetical protein
MKEGEGGSGDVGKGNTQYSVLRNGYYMFLVIPVSLLHHHRTMTLASGAVLSLPANKPTKTNQASGTLATLPLLSPHHRGGEHVGWGQMITRARSATTVSVRATQIVR